MTNLSVTPLTAEKLRRICDPTQFSFATTADLPPTTKIIGQPRGTRAIEFGIGIQSDGFNIFILGPTGTGRATAIRQFLQEKTGAEPTPDDWVVVNNFVTAHQPHVISLPAGKGCELRGDMERLITALQQTIPSAFDSDSYRESISQRQAALEQTRETTLRAFQQESLGQNFGLARLATGLTVVPMQEGQPLTAEMLQTMSPEQVQALQAQQRELNEQLQHILTELREQEVAAQEEMKELDRQVAETAVAHQFSALLERYGAETAVVEYLNAVKADVLNQIDGFAPPVGTEANLDLRRYEVNVLVDNSQTEGAPVISEPNPTYNNLFGRLEYEMVGGLLTTHFTNLKCGSLHVANGGYLMLSAQDLLQSPNAWPALKRALRNQEISIQPAATMNNGQVLAKSLAPEPIPLDVKVVLMGSPELFYALYYQDDDFSRLFKVRADFDGTMPYGEANIDEYAQFIATRCHEEKLRHFAPSGIAKVVEHGSRLVEDQNKLSTRFGLVADLVREASYWATVNGSEAVTADDVQQALRERTYRASFYEQRTLERILEEQVFVATDGAVVGQVNGLSVIEMGEHQFGVPGRITARTFVGDGGVVHIERETDMSGPIHDKGVLTLNGYLGGMYAHDHPLAFAASMTFEQNYGGIDGDSASSTELYALLSSLSGLPIKQGIAVTGSVNQRGEIQPIGGVNEKIEGFFKICKARGLTGEQGVMIPASNVSHLMLSEEVVTAVSEQQFHIWPLKHVDEGIALLTGVPAGVRNEEGEFPENSVHYTVVEKLRQLESKRSGSKDEDESEDEEE